MEDARNPLGAMLRRAARGTFPAPDGSVRVLGPPSGPTDAVVAFTAHHVIAADVGEREVLDRLAPDDLGAPMQPPFLQWLQGRLGSPAGMLDLVLVAGRSDREELALRALPGEDGHPRVDRSRRYRQDVRVYTDDAERGVVILGRGLAGRCEVSVEIEPEHRAKGLGRALAGAARALVPPDEPLFAQVSPGNVASLRAFMAAGFRPVCAEVLFLRRSLG